MMPVPEKMAHQDADKRFFFVCVVFGIASILVLRTLSGQSEQQFTAFDWLAVGAGVFIIITYSVYVSNPKLRSSISLDRASDNAYYMGLLFTLSSLAFSLYKISLYTTQIEPSRVISLLPDFGVALFCTIVGIAARVALQQFGDDNYAESIARDEMSVAVSKFKNNLVQSNNSMRSLNLAMQDTAKKAMEQMRSMSADNANIIRDTHEHARALSKETLKQLDALNESSKQITRVTHEISTHCAKLNAELKDVKIQPKFQATLERLDDTVGNLNQRYKEMFETHIQTAMIGKEAIAQLKSLGKLSDATLKDLRRNAKRTAKTSDLYIDILERSAKQIHKNSQRGAKQRKQT